VKELKVDVVVEVPDPDLMLVESGEGIERWRLVYA